MTNRHILKKINNINLHVVRCHQFHWCRFDYLHKKQTGGAGQFGRIIGRLVPLTGDELSSLQFVDAAVGMCIPKQFVPAIEKGYREICDKGTPSRWAPNRIYYRPSYWRHLRDLFSALYRLLNVINMANSSKRNISYCTIMQQQKNGLHLNEIIWCSFYGSRG